MNTTDDEENTNIGTSGNVTTITIPNHISTFINTKANSTSIIDTNLSRVWNDYCLPHKWIPVPVFYRLLCNMNKGGVIVLFNYNTFIRIIGGNRRGNTPFIYSTMRSVNDSKANKKFTVR
jgi:hypothetical protein